MPTTSPLYERLIDYAGVFPPAALDVGAALAEYADAGEGPHGWMLGPILLKASQAAGLDPPALAALDGRLGLIADQPVSALEWGADAPPPGLAQVEAVVDVGGGSDLDLDDLRRLAGPAPVLYVESADADRLGDLVVAVAAARRAGSGPPGGPEIRAKVRTGGPTPGHFPTPEALASFLLACATHVVPFKATAGLHEPFRHPSGEVDGAVEHGFVNLLAATRAALAGEDDAVAAALAETDPSAFDPADASWKDAGTGVLAGDVRTLFRSYGSCSFAEPVEHLVRLGVLQP